MTSRIEVVGAVIVRDGLVLCVQRSFDGSLPGLWEFPGGKIEPNEEPRDALAREIDEELRCEVTVGEVVTTTTYEYSFGTVWLTTYYCDLIAGEPTLQEHAEMLWAHPSQLPDLEWAAADIPAVGLVHSALGGASGELTRPPQTPSIAARP